MLTRPPGGPTQDVGRHRQPIPGNTNRHLRMSPQFAALRSTAKSPVEVGTVLWMQNPRITPSGARVERRSDSPGTPLRGPESWRYAQLGNSPEWRGFFPPTLDSPDSLRGVPAIDPQGSRGRNVGRLCRPHSFFSFSNGGRRSSPCLKAGVSAAKKLMTPAAGRGWRRHAGFEERP